jgi:hypothetical protein
LIIARERIRLSSRFANRAGSSIADAKVSDTIALTPATNTKSPAVRSTVGHDDTQQFALVLRVREDRSETDTRANGKTKNSRT